MPYITVTITTLHFSSPLVTDHFFAGLSRARVYFGRKIIAFLAISHHFDAIQRQLS